MAATLPAAAIEGGFSCAGTPSTCVTTCGDGIIAGAEACDDGKVAAGDGCGAACQIEAGWSCTGAPSMCTTQCGDGIVAGAETCDDAQHGGWRRLRRGLRGRDGVHLRRRAERLRDPLR